MKITDTNFKTKKLAYILRGKGPVERIKYKDYTVLLKHEVTLLFCYAYKGLSYIPMRKIQKFMNILKSKEKIWKTLELEYSNSKSDILEEIDPIVDHVFNNH